MICSSPSRRGSALMMVMAIVAILVALTLTLSTNTVSRLQSERSRDDQVELLAASESAANEAVAWLQANSTAVDALPEYPSIITGNATSEAQYNAVAALPSTSKVSSTITPMIQAIPLTNSAGTVTGTVPGCAANMRNGCAVEVLIVCLHQTAAGNTYPDGNEKYLIFSTATKGDKALDAARFQRRRVMTVVRPQPTQVFKQSMYGISSYDVGGSAGSDSFSGASTYLYGQASTGNGIVKSGGTVTTSGSAVVDGKQSGVKLSLPTLTYNPPSGTTSLGALSAPVTLSGGTNYRASSVSSGATLTVSGSGTVTLYVDGPFNTSSVRFAAGSTASLVIKQANYASSLGATSFDLGGLVGDIQALGHGAHNDYASENDATKAPDCTRLQFYSGYTGNMTFNGNGAMAGVIYAPQANIQMNGTFQFFGALIADGFSGRVNGTFNFHFDDRLGSMTLPINPQFSATGWNIYNVSVSQN